MPVEQLYDQFADLKSLESQKTKVVGIFTEIKNGIKELNGLGVRISGATGIKELNGVSKDYQKIAAQLADAQKRLADQEKELDSLRDKSAAKTKILTSEQALLNQQTSERNSLVKLQAQLENSVVGSREHAATSIKILEHQQKILNTTTESGKKKYAELSAEIVKQKTIIANSDPYKKLITQFEAAAREAKNLAAQYGVLDPRAQAAAKSANDLANKLKTIDEGVGQHQRSVGNYAKAWDGVKESIKSALTGLLAYVGAREIFGFLKDSVNEFAELQKNIFIFHQLVKNISDEKTFQRLQGEIEDLHKEFNFLNRADITHVFEQLIAYGKLTETQFKELLPIIINYSTYSGKSLEESTAVIVKALEGGKRGVREFGLEVSTNNTVTQNLAIILEQLGPKLKKVGEEFKTTVAGGLAAAKERLREFKEETGSWLTTAGADMLNWLDKASDNFKLFINRITQAKVYGADMMRTDSAKAKVDQQELERLTVLLGNINKQVIANKDSEKGLAFYLGEQARVMGEIANINLKIRPLVLPPDAHKPGYKEPILGTGDPNADLNKPRATPPEDFGKDVARLQKELNQLLHELNKLRLQDEIDTNNEILSNTQNVYKDRLNAAEGYYDKSKLLLQENLQYELQANTDAIDEEKRQVELKLNKKGRNELTIKQREDLNKELELLTKKEAANEVLIREKYSIDTLKLEKTYEKQFTDIYQFESDRRRKIREDEQKFTESHQRSIQEVNIGDIQNQYSIAQKVVDQHFLKNELSQRQYDATTKALNKALQLDLIQEDIKYTEAYIAQTKIRQQADEQEIESKIQRLAVQASIEKDPVKRNADFSIIKQAEEDLKNLRITDNDKIANSEEKLAALRIKFDAEAREEIIKSQEQIKEGWKNVREEALKGAEDIILGSITSQKNAIQDQIDKIDELKAADEDRVNHSTRSEEQKAAAIHNIETKAQNDKEALARKQRQLDVKSAIFQRAFQIFQINIEAIKTVQAIVASASAAYAKSAAAFAALGPEASFTIAAIEKAAILKEIAPVIASAAIQIAGIAASPVPHYAEGVGEVAKKEDKKLLTGDSHKGGASVIGERKDKIPELVEEPSGKTYIVDKPTLFKNLPKGTRVLPLTIENKREITKEKEIVKNNVAAYKNGIGQLNFVSERNDSRTAIIRSMQSFYSKPVTTYSLKNLSHVLNNSSHVLNSVIGDMFTSTKIPEIRAAPIVNIHEKESKDEEILQELKELNKKPPILIINQTPIETTPYYQQHMKY